MNQQRERVESGGVRRPEPGERAARRSRRDRAERAPESWGAERAAEKKARRDARYRRRRRREPYLRAAIAVLGALPPIVAAWLGETAGAAIHRFAKRHRERVNEHLRMAFPDKSDRDRSDIARRVFRTMGRGAASLPTLWRRGVPWLLDRMEIVDEHRMDEALAAGKGAIAVTLHHGPMVAGGVWLAHAWNGVSVGRDARTSDTLQLLIDLRADLGLETIQRGQPREILRALRENRPVAILADHDVASVSGVFVPFFGRLAHTAVGPAALSVRTGAPIVIAISEWVGRTRYRVRVLEVLRPREDLPHDEAVHELTYRYTKVGEDVIRARPDHWLWLHKRWETRPEARPDVAVWRPEHGPDACVELPVAG